MRASQAAINTLKETPAEAEIISHQLMLRAGMLRKLASGLYSWSPVGFRVLKKVEQIIREEMDRAGALEMLMPAVQPAELWQESGRWEQYGAELLRVQDRHARDFCIGPTHEEVITDFARRELKSYRQLPVCYYQIQTKFRDEIRPRFGVMRAREFIMKDAYSYHLSATSLRETYQAMFDAYSRILERMGLTYRAVEADTGAIGGSHSHEFHVLADSGEDAIAYADAGDYAANVEMAPTFPSDQPRLEPSQPLESVATPDIKTIEAVCEHLNADPAQTLKTLLVKGVEHPVVALVLRGDHKINEIKAGKHPLVSDPVTLIEPEMVSTQLGCPVGFVGPQGLAEKGIPVIADYAATVLADFICGANTVDTHLKGANWGRDLSEPQQADLREATAGDPAPQGQGKLAICRGIEVGHVFELGDKYTHAMDCHVLDEQGKPHTPLMGCYGVGVSRIVAAAIEQNYDERGIIWPEPIAPYSVVIVPIAANKNAAVAEKAEQIYQDLQARGVDVILDDRGLRPGVAFADWELLGIPRRVVVSPKAMEAGTLEVRARRDENAEQIKPEQLMTWLGIESA